MLHNPRKIPMLKRRMSSFFYKTRQNDSNTSLRQQSGALGFFGRGLKKLCFYIGALVLFSICMGILSATLFSGSSKSLPNDMILVFKITDPIGEAEHARSLADPFAAAGITIGNLIETLDRAKTDDRVRGLLVSLDNAGMELAHIEELRAAVKRFRASGKFAHIYTASFSDLGSGIGAYYLASAFDQIWLQPTGFVMMTGLSLEMPFARDVLDKVGAKPEFLHREEYKSAMEGMTNSHMSPANRESMQSILDDFSNRIFSDISEDRKIQRTVLAAQMDKGLITGNDALKAGLITNLDYDDVLVHTMRAKINGKPGLEKPPLVPVEDYYAATADSSSHKRNADVALVRISGTIVAGDEPEPGYATGDYIANAIMDAANDDTIKVIVMRVDSPGGSPSASETIRRSIVYAKEKGKKILVSMGPVAASGGYWIVVNADRIFAMPTTLTGSIGVIMGKFEVSELWKKIGVNWDSLTWGKNARLWSMNKPLDAGEREILNAAIDDTYASFISRVAEGRKMTREQVRAVAKGRAWTGTQASKNGLVDEIGGLDVTMDYAAKLVGASSRDDLKIRLIPEPLTPLEQLTHMLGQQVTAGQYPGEGSAVIKAIEPMLRQQDVMERIGPVQVYDMNLPLVH